MSNFLGEAELFWKNCSEKQLHVWIRERNKGWDKLFFSFIPTHDFVGGEEKQLHLLSYFGNEYLKKKLTTAYEGVIYELCQIDPNH